MMKQIFMKAPTRVGIILILLTLAGCASQAEIEALGKYGSEVVKAQTEREQKNTMVIKCESCNGLEVSFLHSADKNKIIVPKITGSNDVAAEAIPVAGSVTEKGIIGVAAVKAVKELSANKGVGNTNTHNTVITNGEDNQITATTELSETVSNVGDTAILSAIETATTTTNTDSNDNNSVINDDHSTVINNDNTATPTVVNPVIVTP